MNFDKTLAIKSEGYKRISLIHLDVDVGLPVLENDFDSIPWYYLIPIEDWERDKIIQENPFIKKHHITSIGGCLKPVQLTMEGHSELKDVHSVTARGIIVHEAANIINNQMLSDGYFFYIPEEFFTYDNLVRSERDRDRISEGMFNLLVPTVAPIVDGLADWTRKNIEQLFKESSLPVMVEKKSNALLMVEAERGGKLSSHPVCIVTGKPDLYTRDSIVDYKTGQNFQKSHLRQISFYEALLYAKDQCPREKRLVYLGAIVGKGGVREKKFPSRATQYNEVLCSQLDEIIKHSLNVNLAEKQGFATAEYGFHCSFCGYRHVCNGI